MKIKNTIILLILSSIIFSCTGAKDALQGKKRSEQSDEFLVEKKNPLELPPDFDDMPVPIEQEENIQRSNDDDLKEILDINTNQSNKENLHYDYPFFLSSYHHYCCLQC